jgi:hypothetical protein
MNTTIKFTDLEDCQSGITELYCEALGSVTFVGFSRQGDAVVQSNADDQVISIPEITFNLWKVQKPFEPETHVRYLKESDLVKLHESFDNIDEIELAEHKSMVYEYEATIHIKKVYDKLGERDDAQTE